MKSKKHKPEQIIKKLREADAMLAPAKTKDSRPIVVSPCYVKCGKQESNLHDRLRSLGPQPSASANSAIPAMRLFLSIFFLINDF